MRNFMGAIRGVGVLNFHAEQPYFYAASAYFYAEQPCCYAAGTCFYAEQQYFYAGPPRGSVGPGAKYLFGGPDDVIMYSSGTRVY